MSGASRTPRFTHRTPVPLGPPSLWAERERASETAVSAFRSQPLPACTASQKKSAPPACAAAASSFTGWMTPVSLLTAITATSRAPRRTASSTAAGEMRPSAPQGRRICSPRSPAADRTAACSMAETAKGAPAASRRTAQLSASVPPEVKYTSFGFPPRREATRSRASVTR